MTPQPPRWPLVEVRWVDAVYREDVDWTDLDSLTTSTCSAVGHLVRETDVDVSVCLEAFEDGTLRRILTIPRGMLLGKPKRLR